MKIHVLPLPDSMRPSQQPFRYPAGNDDYGVEQEFLDWLNEHPELTTTDPQTADFHYLPVFWTRYHLNHNYGKDGQEALKDAVTKSIRDDAKTFTICQYDDGPLIDLGRAVLFLASRKTPDGIDIPLLRAAHHLPFWKPAKKYLASFVGRLGTHPMRQTMANAVQGQKNILIADGDRGVRFFVRTTLASYAVLAPRGYGGSSFRAFEAMQLGIAPFVIGDLDTRPFRSFVDWDSFGFYTSDPARIPETLAGIGEARLLDMGHRAHDVYERQFAQRRWCPYVIEELKART
jgi:hypothetical protein